MTHELTQRLASLRGKWAEIARLADVDTSTVYRIAKGKSYDHRIGTYRRISNAIDIVLLRQTQDQN